METSKTLTGNPWNDLPLFAEGIPVSLSVKQVTAKVKKILATCGLGFDKPLANYDPATQSWKMSEGIFPLGERPSLPTLPPSGMTRSGALFQQPAWEPITGVTASSSWPTPTAVTRPMEGNVRMYREKVQAGEMTETEAEAILGKSVWEAQGKIPAMWPTPTAVEWKGRGPNSKQQGLAEHVKMWPTPTADEAKNAYSMTSQFNNLRTQVGASPQTGKLNPTWVEWLMGFPTAWTDLEDSETP